MKLNIPRADLVSALSLVKSAAGKGGLPVLTHVAITAHAKSVEFCCSDLDLTVRTRVPAQIKCPGDTTVRAALLHDLARSLSDEHLDLELAGELLKLTGPRSDYELATIAKEEFPPVTRVKDGVEFKLAENDLHAALAQTHFAMSTDAARFILCGTSLQLNGSATLSATDGRRLAVGTAPNEGEGKMDVILPGRAVNELLRLLDPASERKVVITVGANAAQFTFGDTILNTKVIEGQYPNYRQVIPSETGAHSVALSRADLLGAVRRVELVSPESCSLEFAGQMLTIRGTDASNGRACETLLIPKCPDLTLHFHPRYLVDALSARTDDELLFIGRDAKTPAMFKAKAGDWFCVVCSRSPEEAQPKQTKPETKPAKKA